MTISLGEAGRTRWVVVRAAWGSAGAVAEWVKRAIAELPAASLNRVAATCAMHLDLEALKRTGKSPGYAKSVVDELAMAHMAKAKRARNIT